MIPKKYRLPLRNEQNIFSVAKTKRVSSFLIKFRNSNLEHSRIAVVVGKKVSTSAVIRNKIRRQVVQHLYQSTLPALSSVKDLVIIVLPDILNAEIKTAIHQLHIALINLN